MTVVPALHFKPIVYNIELEIDEMRSFQLMRYARRMSPTANDFNPSTGSTPEEKRRNSIFILKNERRSSSAQFDLIDESNVNRINSSSTSVEKNHFMDLPSTTTTSDSLNKRHTLNVQKVTPPIDGVNYNRRQSLGAGGLPGGTGRRLSFQTQEITESSKSKTNLRNFYVFFVSLFLFIFLAVVYSFIRMIKNQAA